MVTSLEWPSGHPEDDAIPKRSHKLKLGLNLLLPVHSGQGDQIGRMERFSKITNVAKNLGLFFPLLKAVIIFYKKWVGLHFANSSGRPDSGRN
jgi:hypothetical protein